MPTVASLAAWWAAFRGPSYATDPVDFWQFDLDCLDVEHGNQTCQDYIGQARVGHVQYTGGTGPAAALGQNLQGLWRSSVLAFKGTNATRYDEVTQETEFAHVSSPTAALATTAPDSGKETPLAIHSWAPPGLPATVGIGLVAMGLAMLYYLWPALRSGGLGLFSRVRTDKLLDNPVRAEIHQAIEARPGIHQQDLVRLVGKGNGTVEHHLRKLLDAGLVTRVQGTGYTCYFLKGSTDRHTMAAAPVLKSPIAQAVLEAARLRPGVPPSVLARELGVSPPTISYHLRRLESAGLVTVQDGVRAVAA